MVQGVMVVCGQALQREGRIRRGRVFRRVTRDQAGWAGAHLMAVCVAWFIESSGRGTWVGWGSSFQGKV